MTSQILSQKKYRVRKGDEVVVLTGRSKGSVGTIESVDRKSDKVVIAGVNLFKKHMKPSPLHPDGGIVDHPMPIHVSNVAVVDPKSKKPTRVGYKIDGDTKVRIAKRSGAKLG